jgi:hypothetical protein
VLDVSRTRASARASPRPGGGRAGEAAVVEHNPLRVEHDLGASFHLVVAVDALEDQRVPRLVADRTNVDLNGRVRAPTGIGAGRHAWSMQRGRAPCVVPDPADLLVYLIPLTSSTQPFVIDDALIQPDRFAQSVVPPLFSKRLP